MKHFPDSSKGLCVEAKSRKIAFKIAFLQLFASIHSPIDHWCLQNFLGARWNRNLGTTNTIGGPKNVRKFFLEMIPLGVKTCGESEFGIFEAKKHFPDSEKACVLK
jgi:hypothetical protein